MGLMDKVKEQASQLAQMTQEAAAQGKARLDQAQATLRGEALLRNLGAAVYADRTGRGGPDSQAKIDALIEAVSQHEKENGLDLVGDAGDQPGEAGAQPGAGDPPQDPPSD